MPPNELGNTRPCTRSHTPFSHCPLASVTPSCHNEANATIAGVSYHGNHNLQALLRVVRSLGKPAKPGYPAHRER